MVIEEKLYCYMQGSYLERALTDPVFLDWLMPVVGVPGKPAQLKRLSPAEKLAAIERQLDHLRTMKTSLWYGVEAAEIVAASIFRAAPRRDAARIFGAVKQEKALTKPVARWLKQAKKADVYGEVPMGTKRIDLVAHRKGSWLSSDLVVAVELKNELEQMKRGLDQMTTFASYATEVYLACTPFMCAEYLNKHAEAQNVHHWDPGILNGKLQQFGFGLLLVHGDTVFETIRPRGRTLGDGKLREVLAAVEQRKATLY